MNRCQYERGQALPLIVMLLVAALGAATLLAALGARAGLLARAQSAADAAALAAVHEPGRAEEMAAANGAWLIGVDRWSGALSVEVDYGGETAAATARVPSPQWRGLQPVMVAAMRTAEALLGEPLPVVSGFRSRAEQQRLWDHRHENAYPVAPPGTSRHERGLAIDVPLGFVGRLAQVAGRAGLCQPLPHTDPVHFQLCPGTLTL